MEDLLSSPAFITPPPIEKELVAGQPLDPNTPTYLEIADNGQILKNYLTYKRVAQTLVDSYDDFLNYRALAIAQHFYLPIKTKDGKTLGRIFVKSLDWDLAAVGNTTAGPQDAYNKDASYTTQSRAFLELQRLRDTGYETVHTGGPYLFGRIPAMVGSSVDPTRELSALERFQLGLCPSYPDGYFIIKGKPKFIVLSQKLRENLFRIYYNVKTGNMLGSIITSTINGTSKVSLVEKKNHVIEVGLKLLGYEKSSETSSINVYQIFFLLRQLQKEPTRTEEITELILSYIRPEWQARCALRLAPTALLREGEPMAKIHAITKMKGPQASIERQLQEELLTSLFPQSEDLESRIQLLAYITARFLEYMAGFRVPVDRNSLSQNRLANAGTEIAELYTQIMRLMRSEQVLQMDEEDFNSLTSTKVNQRLVDIASRVNCKVNETFTTSFGNKWGLKMSGRKESVVEALKNDSITLVYAQLTRISKRTSGKGKQPDARAVHPSHLGFICLVDSPEGEKCGLVKYLAITCYLSRQRPEGPLLEFLEPYLSKKRDLQYHTMVILNGRLLGWTSGELLYEEVRRMRRSGKMGDYSDIYAQYDAEDHVLQIFTDAGRTVRPLLVVENGELLIDRLNLWGADFQTLLKAGVVEYIDAAEQEVLHLAQRISSLSAVRNNLRDFDHSIAQLERDLSQASQENRALISDELNKVVSARRRYYEETRYTHSELHPTALLGVAASLVPLQNHNMGSRNSYACNMVKQSITITHSNMPLLKDNALKASLYPSPPIFETQMSKIIGTDRLPTGSTVRVAIMTQSGNQEDAIIFNQSAVERGLFTYVVYWTYDLQEEFCGDEVLRIVATKDNSYLAHEPAGLDEYGLIQPGKRVATGDILVSAVWKNTVETEKGRNASLRVRLGERGVVDSVIVSGQVGGRLIRIKLREVRKDEMGDKFSSRSSNKGVIGRIVPDHEMPYSEKTGQRPDIIINPIGFVGRMTVNMMIEIIASKAAAFRGERVDATTFNKVNIEEVTRTLVDRGYSASGNERMRSGLTSRRFEAEIYVGPCYYQALRHHVKDKIQAQARTEKRVSSNQPIRGRRRGGVIRYGEQERDALVSHGARFTLQDVLTGSSDVYSEISCLKCGTAPALNLRLGGTEQACPNCKAEKSFVNCELPGSFRYLAALLTGLNLGMRLDLVLKKDIVE